MIALCDVNNFYVSCERLFDPTLIGRPCLVLSGNDGCAIARSNEVKSLGIKMGAPLHEIKHLVKQHNIAIKSSCFPLYGDMSHRVDAIIDTYCHATENYSIDESWMDYSTGYHHLNLVKHNQQMVKQIQQWLGLPVCVGLAPSKTLAKIANYWAKKLKIPGSVLQLNNEYHVKEALKYLPVDEIWGVGRRLSTKLNQMGITTALDLYQADAKTMRKRFSVLMERTILELRGISCIDFDADPEKKKQIICSRSFGKKLEDFDSIVEAMVYHVSRGAQKLREQKSKARSLLIGITTNGFSKTDKQYRNSINLQLPEHTSDTTHFVNAARIGLKKIFKSGFKYKKVSIMYQDLCDQDAVQGNLFDPFPQSTQSNELMGVLDGINSRFGKGVVRIASEGFNRGWEMRANHKSPAYTTRLSDIISVR